MKETEIEPTLIPVIAKFIDRLSKNNGMNNLKDFIEAEYPGTDELDRYNLKIILNSTLVSADLAVNHYNGKVFNDGDFFMLTGTGLFCHKNNTVESYINQYNQDVRKRNHLKEIEEKTIELNYRHTKYQVRWFWPSIIGATGLSLLNLLNDIFDWY